MSGTFGRMAELLTRELSPSGLRLPGGPGMPYGIIDPDYARYYTKIRCTAWQHGYAIAMHGSFTRDLDLVAIPWEERACAPDTLIAAIEYRTDLKRQGPPSERAHGRLSVSMLLPGFEDPRWIDLSILPRQQKPADTLPA